MTPEEQIAEIRSLLSTLTSAVTAHDNQIGQLITIAERQESRLNRHIEATNVSIRALADEIQNLTREWQAYLRRLPPQ